MWPDDEKAAENTCCIVKGFEEVWTHFCPSKPSLPLSTDTGGMRIRETAKTAPVLRIIVCGVELCRKAPPLCKGRWVGVSRVGGIV